MPGGRIDKILVAIRILSLILDHFFLDFSSFRDGTYCDQCCHLSNVCELMYATQPMIVASSSSLASAEVYALYRVLSRYYF